MLHLAEFAAVRLVPFAEPDRRELDPSPLSTVAIAVWILLSAKSNKSSYLNMILRMYLWVPTIGP